MKKYIGEGQSEDEGDPDFKKGTSNSKMIEAIRVTLKHDYQDMRDDEEGATAEEELT